jgi:hypothetical protein
LSPKIGLTNGNELLSAAGAVMAESKRRARMQRELVRMRCSMKYCPKLCNKVLTKETVLVSRSTFLVLLLQVCGRWSPANPARARETLNDK